MSCCNKCNTNNCGCNDTALTNPCTYTDCSGNTERCEDVQCAECVSYCGDSFQIGEPRELLVINKGERLESIIQKFALMIAKGLGSCTSNDDNHGPYNLYTTDIASSTVDLSWDGIFSGTVDFNVYYAEVNTTNWTLSNINPISVNTTSWQITGLTPATQYKIKVESNDNNTQCDSVELLVETLL